VCVCVCMHGLRKSLCVSPRLRVVYDLDSPLPKCSEDHTSKPFELEDSMVQGALRFFSARANPPPVLDPLALGGGCLFFISVVFRQGGVLGVCGRLLEVSRSIEGSRIYT